MKFTFDGQRYAIVFQYDWTVDDDADYCDGRGQHRQMTRLMLFTLPRAKGDTPLAEGTVYRHFKDKNCKEAARKAALLQMFRDVGRTWLVRNKEFRAAAWQAYLNRKQVPQSANAPANQAVSTGQVERQQQQEAL